MLDLEPIKARLADAPQGPWNYRIIISKGESTYEVYQWTTDNRICTLHDAGELYGTVEFIATAPTDIAALLEEVDRLRKMQRQAGYNATL